MTGTTSPGRRNSRRRRQYRQQSRRDRRTAEQRHRRDPNRRRHADGQQQQLSRDDLGTEWRQRRQRKRRRRQSRDDHGDLECRIRHLRRGEPQCHQYGHRPHHERGHAGSTMAGRGAASPSQMPEKFKPPGIPSTRSARSPSPTRTMVGTINGGTDGSNSAMITGRGQSGAISLSPIRDDHESAPGASVPARCRQCDYHQQFRHHIR